MQLNSVEELIADIRQGKMVILMDDEDRENEGDLIMAAEMVRPSDINFMAKHARGLICLPMTRERCDYLGLGLMVNRNNAQFQTNFTVSIEAAEGVTTGISAADRAHTIRVAVGRQVKPQDLVQPGHVFPLIAQPGGVLSRAGHTEAGCDLARLAGFEPAAVIVEIMDEDGTMARRPQLEAFAAQHDLKIGTIADLIHYRATTEQTIERVQTHELNTEYGTFKAVTYRDTIQGFTHLALVMGEPDPKTPTLVRVHFADVLRDLLRVSRPDSESWPIGEALGHVAKEGKGVVVLLDSEGKGLDLNQQINDYMQPRKPQNLKIAGSGAYLTIGTGSQILRDLGVGKMRVMSAPMKFSALSGFDLEVEEYLPYRAGDQN
ncbi:MAG: 3,4-dihydroxy-2-butanone-4-phosphate synthase [Hahellaceae bacterium]|nr:3,4-dihydroxy-2-butanone-4-phosphate synthase [Hahellaceae bacterium]